MIKILHISDLHFYKDAQTYNMQEILLKEAKEAFQDVPEGYKLLVITGDYHNYADKNYDMAEAFLNDLISAMGLNRKNDVFMVPGNHDVGNKDTLEPLKIDPDDVFAYTQMIKNGKKKIHRKEAKSISSLLQLCPSHRYLSRCQARFSKFIATCKYPCAPMERKK